MSLLIPEALNTASKAVESTFNCVVGKIVLCASGITGYGNRQLLTACKKLHDLEVRGLSWYWVI